MKEFSYEEVEAATGGFAAKNLVGKGSHGSVYRARLRGVGSGRTAVVVAVKRPSHAQGEAKLANEIAVLSAAPRHPGVIGIVGVSSSSSPPPPQPQPAEAAAAAGPRLPSLLVMEFMPNGSLHDLLHRSPRPPPWPRRVEIALDVARAVQALHAAAPRAIIHRDVKSANVLLGRDGRARLADFSLAVCVKAAVHATPPGAEEEEDDKDDEDEEEGGSASSAAGPAPAGTIGYLDPCYTEPERLGPESDVFSFGVVLLELVSGRKVMDVNACPSSIVSWAAPLIGAGRAREVLDARLPAPPTARADRAVARVLALAARCVSETVDRRPDMDEVVSELRGALESAGWRHRHRHRHHHRGDSVVERVCRRVASWGQRVRRSSSKIRVRATKVECTEHSDSVVVAAPGSSSCAAAALPSHRNNGNGTVMSGAASAAHSTQSKAKENALNPFERELDLVFSS